MNFSKFFRPIILQNTSGRLHIEKTLEYFKIQESLRSEYRREYYLRKGMFFMFFATLQDIL